MQELGIVQREPGLLERHEQLAASHASIKSAADQHHEERAAFLKYAEESFWLAVRCFLSALKMKVKI